MRNFRINLKAVSISLGIILWLYVNLVIPPLVRRTVKAKIDFRNIPARTRILPQTSETEIVLTGTRRDFIFAGKDSIQPSVDLYTLRPGPAFFPVKVTTPSGLSVVAMKPAQVEVTGEILVSRKMEITVDIKGVVAEGFLAERPMASPSHVLIEGPRDLVEKAVSCQVSLAVGDYKNSISETGKVSVFGPDGEIEKGLTVIPDKANISVAVKAGFPSRMFTIVSQFINKPPEGFKLASATFTPSEIMISGPQRVLDQYTNIRTLPIDLSALSSASNTLIALLDPPAFENVKIVGSNTVSLSILLTPIPIIKTFSGLPLTLKHSPTQHCSVSPASYSLVLRGFAEDLSKIALADLTIVFDTREMIPGTYTPPLPCPTGLPKKVEVLEILPPKATIVVSPFDPSPVASGTQPGN